jgi:hypothetical protein
MGKIRGRYIFLIYNQTFECCIGNLNMARELSTRLTITGILQATTPLHIGGMPNNAEEDMPLAKNGLGNIAILKT